MHGRSARVNWSTGFGTPRSVGMSFDTQPRAAGQSMIAPPHVRRSGCATFGRWSGVGAVSYSRAARANLTQIASRNTCMAYAMTHRLPHGQACTCEARHCCRPLLETSCSSNSLPGAPMPSSAASILALLKTPSPSSWDRSSRCGLLSRSKAPRHTGTRGGTPRRRRPGCSARRRWDCRLRRTSLQLSPSTSGVVTCRSTATLTTECRLIAS
jgi:hypothetical protein